MITKNLTQISFEEFLNWHEHGETKKLYVKSLMNILDNEDEIDYTHTTRLIENSILRIESGIEQVEKTLIFDNVISILNKEEGKKFIIRNYNGFILVVERYIEPVFPVVTTYYIGDAI